MDLEVSKLKEFCSRFGGEFEVEGDIYSCVLDNLFTGEYFEDLNTAKKLASELPKLFNGDIIVEPQITSARKMTILFVGKGSNYGELDIGNEARGLRIDLVNTGSGYEIGLAAISGESRGCAIEYNFPGRDAIFVCRSGSNADLSRPFVVVRK